MILLISVLIFMGLMYGAKNAWEKGSGWWMLWAMLGTLQLGSVMCNLLALGYGVDGGTP